MRFAGLATVFLWTFSASGQDAGQRVSTSNFNGWYMYFGDHPIKGRWELHLENQWRRNDGILKWQQNLFRPGVNFALNERVTLTAGYANIVSWPYGEYAAPRRTLENRVWQQALVSHGAGKVRLQHRFREEQRWIREYEQNGGAKGWRYQNRFRYFVKLTAPVRGKWFSAFYEEIFLNIAPNKGARTFDQNRAYAAIGRRIGRRNSIEAGYLYQLVAQRNGLVTEHNHTLQIGWYSRLPFGR